MKVASWFTYFGPGRIGISRGVPRNAKPGFKLYKPLYPTREMLAMPLHEYTPRYEAILAALDPEQVWADLHELAQDAEPVLLCWEHLKKPGEWCHRTQVSLWLKATLGRDVEEFRA